ncbi:MAG: glycosyltransferase family 2 protein [Opitutaceae bacterium]|jgi:glycosyltransferase involved in cell wall biosynthesis|nr:glycosyltransferase family 2 protein [Opitutaceae bacterium]
MPLLTIAIPTYDRNEMLMKTLGLILPQIGGRDVSVLVIDDASPEPVGQAVLAAAEKHGVAAQVRTHRNPSNVGLSANSCRCVELSDGEWVWPLSDDDIPRPDGVDSILRVLQTVEPECVDIKLSAGGGGGFAHEFSVNGHLEYAALFNTSPGFFWRDIFMSTTVFRRSAYLKNICHAYYGGPPTVIPLIIMKILALKSGGSAQFRKEIVVDPQPVAVGGEASWDRSDFYCGLTLLDTMTVLSDWAAIAMPGVTNAIFNFRGKRWFSAASHGLRINFIKPAHVTRFYISWMACAGGVFFKAWLALLAFVMPVFHRYPVLRRAALRLAKTAALARSSRR